MSNREIPAGQLKQPRQGFASISLSIEMLEKLDTIAKQLSSNVGFKVSRTQAVGHLITSYESLHKEP